MNKRKRRKQIEYIAFEDDVYGVVEAVGFLERVTPRHIIIIPALINDDTSSMGTSVERIPVKKILCRTVLKRF